MAVKNGALFAAVVVAVAVVTSAETMQEEEKECATQLQNLAACVPYVSGSAKSPTPQCCNDAEKVRSSNPKCLCVLIIESTDASMALPINTTLALQMPKACNSEAKVSDCPSILNLPSGSPDAKIFTDASGALAATVKPSSSSSGGSGGTTSASGNRRDGVETLFTAGVACLIMPYSLMLLV